MGFLKDRKKRRKAKAEKTESMRLRRAILTAMYQDFALNRSASGVTDVQREVPVVVSLTTFSERINDVHLTIESLLQQSCRPDKVVLWVSREEFSEQDIPAMLRLQCQRGLEIEFCERNLGPYKKFFYALQKYPQALVLTVDDDVLYPPDMVDQLYRAHCRQPDVVHCHRAHRITFDAQGQLKPYMEWDLSTDSEAMSERIFPTGVGGVLYFPGCFDAEIMNETAFLELAPKADDIWLKAMTLKRGTGCQVVADPREWEQRFLFIEGSQKFALKHGNTKGPVTGNDVKLKAVFDRYQLWAKLKA